MRIAFVSPPTGAGVVLVADLLHGCWCQGDRVGGLRLPPLPLLTLAAIARCEGHEPVVIDAANEGTTAGSLLRRAEGWDMLVLHVSSASIAGDLGFAREARRMRPGLPIVAFGAEPTFRPALIRESGLFAHLLAGPPEAAFAALIARAASAKYATMEELPMPAVDLLSRRARYFNPVGAHRRFVTLVTSRGCPGRCAFCTVPAFYGRRYDAQSGARVAADVSALVARGYREVFFRDENFTTSRARVLAFCEEVRRGCGPVPFIISSRVDLVDAELLGALRAAGCRYVRYGVESGSDALLAQAGKGTCREQIVETFRRTAEAGIHTHAHFVAGLPGETRGQREETTRLIREIRPHTITIGLFTPLPGSAYWREREERGVPGMRHLDAARLHLVADPGVARTAAEREELESFPARAYREYYLRPGYLLRSLASCRSLEELLIKARSGAGVLRFGAGRS